MKNQKEIRRDKAYSLYALVLLTAFLVLLLSSCARELKTPLGDPECTIYYRYRPETPHRY